MLLEILQNSHENTCVRVSFLIKLQTSDKQKVNMCWHRYFPVNFAKFLRTPFLQNTSGQLLLSLANYNFLQETLINIKICHFHSCINHQKHLFLRKLITSYLGPVNVAKFLRTALYRTPPEAVVCRCSSK